MDRLQSTIAGMDKITGRIDRATASGNVDEIMMASRRASADLRAAAAEIKDAVASLNLEETGSKVSRWAECMETHTTNSAIQVRMASENLRRASENLDGLLRRLEANPSDLIFSSAPKGEK